VVGLKQSDMLALVTEVVIGNWFGSKSEGWLQRMLTDIVVTVG